MQRMSGLFGMFSRKVNVMKKALLIASFVGVAAISSAQTSHLLRIKAKAGQSYRYQMNVDTGMGAQTMKIGMQMAMKVAKVQNNQFTVNTTMGSVTMGGKPAPPAVTDQLAKMLITTIMDARGRILKTETKGIPGMAPGAGQGSSIPFPQNAIKIGGTWTGEADIQGQKVKTSYKLIQIKSILGKQAAVIHATPTGMTGFKSNGPIVYSVELATGFPLSMSMSGTATQGTSVQNMKMSMRRL